MLAPGFENECELRELIFFCCVASGVLRLNPGRLKSDEGAFSYRPGEDAAASEASSKFYERSEYFFAAQRQIFLPRSGKFFFTPKPCLVGD